MKFNLRNAAWTLALATAITLFGTIQLANAQSDEGMEHGRGHDHGQQNRDRDQANNASYQQGINHGQEDRANNREHQYRIRPDNDADRRAYEAGYDQGYQNNRGGYDRDRDANRDSNQQYGQYGNDGQRGQYRHNNQYGQFGSQAARMGYQDGLNDGRKDRQTGHSNRPTKGDNYKRATRGFNNGSSGQTQYKAEYRRAYVPAYQQGYGDGR